MQKNGWSAFNPYLVDGATGNFLAYWTAFVKAGFAFITSPELIALAAGETMAPRRNIPKAAGRYVWRLAIFYGLGSLSIGVIVPRTNNRLLSDSANAAASPFVIGIQLAGIPVLNHIINGAILTSAWSAGNAFVYSGSRVLYSMALNGQAPWIFKYTTRRGVPWVAVLATWGFGLLAFLNVSNSGADVFQWFSSKHQGIKLAVINLTLSRYINHLWLHCVDHYLHHISAIPESNGVQWSIGDPALQNAATAIRNLGLPSRNHYTHTN